MERFEVYIFTALCTTNFLIACLLFSKITREQREPYMDEIFHVPQAQKYCEGNFNEWDPMITTLPGLYLVSVGLIKPLVWLAGWTGDVVCSTGMLRFINLLFNCGNLYLLSLIICKLHVKDKAHTTSRRMLLALSLSTFPVLYFFTFLYYTDAGSTFFILFTYLMSLYGSHKTAALFGVGAILFRQTNVIWVAFSAGSVLAQKLDEAWRIERSKKKEEKSPTPIPLSVGGVGRAIIFLFQYMMSPNNIKTLLLTLWPYIAVAIGFLGFVVANGGIVVGDRSSHKACLHFPQLFYFFSFTLMFSIPASISYGQIVSFLHSLKRKPVLHIFTIAVVLLLVWKFTFVHKYLVSDNRHYTFYVWKKIFQRHKLVPYLLVPGYIFAAWNFMETLKSRSVFWNLVFFMCLTVATVPQKLLEFRYFILPYLMFRLHAPLASVLRLLLEFGLYTAVNAVTLYIFVAKTFHWPDSSDVERFMW
uniref:Dol-P-Glc:Glc(2)Man(9)GlcNAc(2)-PP-Dol alpha-1,2-glucosyltransferase n=1 Tax=Paramormyrops kingsleyae TaxID=1676925 RepID=A0A3B3REC7_9TELE|nr:putative Dol-P-Glc:Glc(2)Man(9)GlcNAc(2)-PP-Dol alpha-1,2-glucosyltransferase [Paramormyrops kingsleyae]